MSLSFPLHKHITYMCTVQKIIIISSHDCPLNNPCKPGLWLGQCSDKGDTMLLMTHRRYRRQGGHTASGQCRCMPDDTRDTGTVMPAVCSLPAALPASPALRRHQRHQCYQLLSFLLHHLLLLFFLQMDQRDLTMTMALLLWQKQMRTGLFLACSPLHETREEPFRWRR